MGGLQSGSADGSAVEEQGINQGAIEGNVLFTVKKLKLTLPAAGIGKSPGCERRRAAKRGKGRDLAQAKF